MQLTEIQDMISCTSKRKRYRRHTY